ncbi:MAG: hypothetical protein EOR04_20270 [Mesorhizobium sp.]|uniref:HD domain-containing protein n=1 Tax=Mesorhizobium sp. TaxID=1871066 RepID=UPI000FE6F04C|nr:ATP-binding protein [Mesorhizobium sp.]RWP40050.1 MAG: hypothetical protein EOR04_20270 [Mesorhizobium sp.]
MKIPTLLASLYQNDHSLSAFVTTAVGTISSHISSSRMEFFPEYTDHNVTHLEGVLSTTTSLMTEEAKALLTPEDAAVLCVATALHDFGMHISKEGFQTLISESNGMVPTLEFTDSSWHSLWQDFLGEATRFDGRKLRAIFGDNFRPVRHPPAAEQPWEDFDYLLVGEFLRRHHPRLAYDIALTGMPAKEGKFIRICQSDTDQQRFLAELAGLVARSHGMELRPCLTYLEKRFQNRVDPRRVRAPYLMVLLRIADFFQIQPQRAPKERTDVVSFKSPLSDLEWRVHQSVTEINNSGSDPEAIVVNANPPDVSSFLRLRSWFSGLQSELDRSWAILGEVYGLQRHNLLSNLNLRIRRIRSNIDNVSEFTSRVNYLPAEVSFTSANNDLLNLLVGPLYGGDIGVGVRELVQNAVDAIREYDDLPDAVKYAHDSERRSISGDVQISIELDEKSAPVLFEIIDRGVGMTADTIVNYFLRAGASFRRSDQWKALHEDEKGHSKVIRSGRFGVGALAAFLLGDEIEVETRHISLNEENGLHFVASVDSDHINVTRLSLPVGTRIRIKLGAESKKSLARRLYKGRKNVLSKLKEPMGYYFSRYPKLHRVYGEYEIEPEPGEMVPSEGDGFEHGWRKFSDENFTVFWKPYETAPRRFLCNGILVKSNHERSLIQVSSSFYLDTPHLSVYDRDGLLPINLQRSEIKVEEAPFFERLRSERVDDFIIYTLVNAPTDGSLEWFGRFYGGARPTLFDYSGSGALWFLSRTGFLPKDSTVVAKFSPKKIILALGPERGFQDWGEICLDVVDEETLIGQYETDAVRQGNRTKSLLKDAILYMPSIPGCIPIANRVLVPSFIRKKVESLSPGKEVRNSLKRLRHFEPSIDAWGESIKQVQDATIAREVAERLWSKESGQTMIMMEIDVNQPAPGEKNSLLADRWLDILETPLIPFDIDARKRLLALARSKLPDLVKATLQNYTESKKFEI